MDGCCWLLEWSRHSFHRCWVMGKRYVIIASALTTTTMRRDWNYSNQSSMVVSTLALNTSYRRWSCLGSRGSHEWIGICTWEIMLMSTTTMMVENGDRGDIKKPLSHKWFVWLFINDCLQVQHHGLLFLVTLRHEIRLAVSFDSSVALHTRVRKTSYFTLNRSTNWDWNRIFESNFMLLCVWVKLTSSKIINHVQESREVKQKNHHLMFCQGHDARSYLQGYCSIIQL